MVCPGSSSYDSIENPLPPDDKHSVWKIREKSDREAFDKIFRIYYPRLYHFALGYLDHEHSEDVIQAVFLKIWANRKNWDPSGSVKNYLYKAVRNEALNILRRQQVELDAKETIVLIFKELKSEKQTQKSLETEDLQKLIKQGVDRLPSRCRQIFLLSKRSGFTYSEIADILDLSMSTVNTQMARAHKYLKKYLTGQPVSKQKALCPIIKSGVG